MRMAWAAMMATLFATPGASDGPELPRRMFEPSRSYSRLRKAPSKAPTSPEDDARLSAAEAKRERRRRKRLTG